MNYHEGYPGFAGLQPEPELLSKSQHIQHWMIDSPNEQATSQGICKGCRVSKRFPNALEYTQERYGRFSKKKKGMARLRSMSLDEKPQHALNYGQDPVKEEPDG